ncbi:MAG: hypothetical protein JWL61_756 [Gemmatimonadetes bacterium]|nr:hypothetical protein [Gemmatimonadota bacterium]
MAAQPDIARTDWLAEYPPPRSLALDQEALRIYEHSYYLGLITEGTGNPPITFSTVIAALLVGDDETSKWCASLAAANGPKPDAVFGEKSLDRARVEEIKRTSIGQPANVQLSSDKHLLTASARGVIGTAEEWAHRVGGTDIGVRHLVASYVLKPPVAHLKQMLGWGYQEANWREAFYAWVGERYSAERWEDSSHRPAPFRGLPAYEQTQVKGEALDYPGDDATLAVLARAAEYHARRSDRALQLQTVFYALVDHAEEHDAVRATVTPLAEATASLGGRFTAAREAFLGTASNAASPLGFSSLYIDPRVLNTLETARDLAIAAWHKGQHTPTVSALHLAGALLSRRVDGDIEFTALGLKPQELRLALIDHAQQHGESGDAWREVLGVEESGLIGRPVDLNSDEPEAAVRIDEPWATDPLLIRRDVESFGALLASKSLEPPLSIGLFGPWGSGKTTFLKRLQRSVKSRADLATKAMENGQSSPYVSEVVHIEFNAWHFAEGALTSSLVDTILRSLSKYIEGAEPVVGAAKTLQMRDKLESTTRRLEAATALERSARATVTTAEETLAGSLATAVSKSVSLRSAGRAAWAAARATFTGSRDVKESGVLEAVGDAVESVDGLNVRLAELRSRPARMLSDLGWPRTLAYAALVLVVPPMAAWFVHWIVPTNDITQALSAVTAAGSMVALWARAGARAVAKVDTVVGRVAAAYANEIDTNSNVATARAGLVAAEGSVATAVAGVEAARTELARAQTELANATLPAQMLQLVSGRIEDRSYSKELTTLSLARADLQVLSKLLYEQRTAPRPANGPKPVDRVILYIDDLDRCKAEDVVRVLQIVHMLLAFELFVVVVAVDANWVEQALRNSYMWLTRDEPVERDGKPVVSYRSGITPQDYLEKIFQISFWLEPMSSSRAASFLSSLVRPSMVETTGAAGASGTPLVTPPAAQSASKVDITAIELAYMKTLAAYLGPSPRRVKRLVNAYRLIKARMSDAQLDKFVGDRLSRDGQARSGPYQLVLGLLAIGTGAPSSSALILRELSQWDPRDSLDEVVRTFRENEHPDWAMAAQVIEMLTQTQPAADVSELRGWAGQVGRFLLKGPTDTRAVRLPVEEPPTPPEKVAAPMEPVVPAA